MRQGCRMGERVPTEPRTPGSSWNHETQRQLPLVVRRPTNVLPIWGPGCPLLPGVSLGKGLDPGGRAGAPGAVAPRE